MKVIHQYNGMTVHCSSYPFPVSVKHKATRQGESFLHYYCLSCKSFKELYPKLLRKPAEYTANLKSECKGTHFSINHQTFQREFLKIKRIFMQLLTNVKQETYNYIYNIIRARWLFINSVPFGSLSHSLPVAL